MVVGLLMIIGAIVLTITETKTLQDTATVLTSLLAGGLLSIYVIGFFSTRGDARHVIVGIIATMTFTLWTIMSSQGVLPETLSYPFDLYYTGLIGNIVMFLIAYGASLFFPLNSSPQPDP